MKKAILFVDDDKNLLDSIGRFLYINKAAITYDFAQSAEDALEKLKETEYNIIVSDQKMEGMTGLTLLSIVRIKYPEMKRVMLSAQINDSVFLEAEKLANKYISKPCDITVLISEIESFLNTENEV